MATGGFRPGAGRPRGSGTKKRKGTGIPGTITPVIGVAPATIPGVQTRDSKLMSPLEYAISVFNDPDQDAERRDRMALNALPYMHLKPAEEVKAQKPKGKKEQRQEIAEEASTEGLFATPAAPKIVVNNQ